MSVRDSFDLNHKAISTFIFVIGRGVQRMPISFDLDLTTRPPNPDASCLKRVKHVPTETRGANASQELTFSIMTSHNIPFKTVIASSSCAGPAFAFPTLQPPLQVPLQPSLPNRTTLQTLHTVHTAGVVRNRLKLPEHAPTVTIDTQPYAPRTVPSMPTSVSTNEEKCTSRADDTENDMYDVGDQNMCIAVLCRNNTGIERRKNSLLGNHGHVERLSAWVHLIGSVMFVVYAAVRHTWAGVGISEYLATVSAGVMAFCFLSSSIYHITSPSKRLAYYTRQLDYGSIYLTIATSCLSDLSVATRGFASVSYLSVIDVPLAALITFAFFIVRRGMLPADESWSTYLGGCTLYFGMMRRNHLDTVHTATRQATSLLLTIGYFAGQAAAFETFGTQTAVVLLALEVFGLIVIIAGMSLDNVLTWPDVSISHGKGPRWLACTGCGCVASGHALWHIVSLLVAIKSAVTREYALSILETL